MMQYSTRVCNILRARPHAQAFLRGSNKYPDIRGIVDFYQTDHGVLVASEVMGLPKGVGKCDALILGFHIHSGSRCRGNADDAFADAGLHFNPYDCNHPYHAGDMPPLFSCDGYAFQMFLTNRFDISQIIGKTVIVHSKADDFSTQPSGNSGEKIACGEIMQ